MRNPVNATPKSDSYSMNLRAARNARLTIRALDAEHAKATREGHDDQAVRIAFRRDFVWRPRLLAAESHMDKVRSTWTTFEGQGA